MAEDYNIDDFTQRELLIIGFFLGILYTENKNSKDNGMSLN
jgi:hypothetical protein